MAQAGISLIWWGSACIDLTIRDTRIVIDPYMRPDDDAVDYVLITHEHYDHCHEPTLRRLLAGDRFKRIVVPPSALVMSKIDSPIESDPEDLAWVDPDKLTVMYPGLTREPGRKHPGPEQIDLGDGITMRTIDSSERPTRYLGGQFVGGHYISGSMPTLGFLIEDARSGLGIFHPGDLHEAFDAQRELRGKVDYMLFPSIKLKGIEQTVLDNIRPRCIIPIHYYLDEPDFPLTMAMGPDDVVATDFATGDPMPGAAPEAYRSEIVDLIEAHWYPTPLDPLAEFAALERELPEDIELRVVTAGRPHELDHV